MGLLPVAVVRLVGALHRDSRRCRCGRPAARRSIATSHRCRSTRRLWKRPSKPPSGLPTSETPVLCSGPLRGGPATPSPVVGVRSPSQRFPHLWKGAVDRHGRHFS
jgi:hypothetical protein